MKAIRVNMAVPVMRMRPYTAVFAALDILGHTAKQSLMHVIVLPVSTMEPVRTETTAITVPVCMDSLDLHVKLVRTFFFLSGPVFGVWRFVSINININRINKVSSLHIAFINLF